MPITMEQVRERLEAIEPDYEEAATLGSDAMPLLEPIATSTDDQLASRAVYLASLIGGDRAVRLLLSAASSPITAVRFQAAAGARNLPAAQAENILLKSLDDPDCGIRNVALKSVKGIAAMSAATQEKIETLSKSDPEQFIREFANNLSQLSHAE